MIRKWWESITEAKKKLEINLFAALGDLSDYLPKNDFLNLALLYDSKILLGNQVLLFSDHLGMHHSLEVRPAFLSNGIYSFSNTLPAHEKVDHSGSTKKILRRVAMKYLPEEIVFQKKEGFQSPIQIWMNSKYYKKELSYIKDSNSFSKILYLDQSKVSRLISGFLNGSTEDFYLVFKLWILEKWLKTQI